MTEAQDFLLSELDAGTYHVDIPADDDSFLLTPEPKRMREAVVVKGQGVIQIGLSQGASDEQGIQIEEIIVDPITGRSRKETVASELSGRFILKQCPEFGIWQVQSNEKIKIHNEKSFQRFIHLVASRTMYNTPLHKQYK
jgi:hypothetical protein